MAPLVIDSECLATVRTLIAQGDTAASIAALDLLTTMSPKPPTNPATPKQTWRLKLMTGHDVRPLNLSYDDAYRMISELTDTGETMHNATHYRTTASADRYRAKQYNTADLPF